MTDLNTAMSIATLNINGLSKYSIQKLEVLRLNEKARSNNTDYKKHLHFKYKDTNRLKMKEKKKVCPSTTRFRNLEWLY